MATDGYILGIAKRLPVRPTAWTGTPGTNGHRLPQVQACRLDGWAGLTGETGPSSSPGSGHGLPPRVSLSHSASPFASATLPPCMPSSRFDATAKSLRHFSPLLISRSVLRGPQRGVFGPRSTTILSITTAPHRGNPGACRGCSIWERIFPLRQAVSLRHC